MTFEQADANLAQAVAQLESGTLSLDESVKVYTQACNLLCNSVIHLHIFLSKKNWKIPGCNTCTHVDVFTVNYVYGSYGICRNRRHFAGYNMYVSLFRKYK